jgi:broad specificity phosphatase PhoE
MLRHGESLANVAGVISSSPTVATVQHGLSDEGRAQAGRAAAQFAALAREQPTAIISSDFLRARETAEIVAAQLHRSQRSAPLHLDKVVLDERLRERSFGEFDGRSVEHYARVWEEDAASGAHTLFGVESVGAVAQRTSDLINELEATLLPTANARPWLVLLVAHGDVLQILQTKALALEPRVHRSIAHLGTAELRKVERPSPLTDYYSEYIEYYDGQLDKGWKS